MALRAPTHLFNVILTITIILGSFSKKTNAETTYVLSGPAATSCPAGSVPLGSAEECEQVANNNGINFDSNFNVFVRVNGCSYDPGVFPGDEKYFWKIMEAFELAIEVPNLQAS
mmetsp:Transcript_14835/g.27892  ORF Transcript_14835/g.27892 Transcript_14835/m.27892 type:complete len:114 (+) Transcript_14835:355-696(+)